jgi:chemotaxis protein MotB
VAAHQPIIVVKKKGKHAGHHGGAWKVAYADFVTAMMAFFLVMWLVSQSKPVKAGVAGYFRDPGAFDTPRGDGILSGGRQPSPQAPDDGKDEAATERARLERSIGHIQEQLKRVPEFKTLEKQIEFTLTSDGLRIDLIDTSGSSFFDSGSAGMRSQTESILKVIARELGTLNNAITVEGHTDSLQYASTDKYTNWELSADRANAARRVMEREALKPGQIVGVRGLADRQLRIVDNRLDPRNRRVSVLVMSRPN